MEPTLAYRKHYVLGDWEGGIAVYMALGEHGTRIISIPRLGLCTTLTGYHDTVDISDMLMKNRTMYANPKEMDHFADLILRDMRNLPPSPAYTTRKKRGESA